MAKKRGSDGGKVCVMVMGLLESSTHERATELGETIKSDDENADSTR